MGKDYQLIEMVCDSTRNTNELIQINNIGEAIRNLRNRRRFRTTINRQRTFNCGES